MKTKSFISSLMFLLLLSSFKEVPSPRQRIDFRVKLAGTHVGTLVAEQWIDSEKTTYALQSKVKVDLLFVIGVEESITDVFENAQLIHSDHKRQVNQKLKAHNTLIRTGNTYFLKNKDLASKKMDHIIGATVLSIYFNEPYHGQKLYSQNFQQMLSIERIGEGRYKVALPNGNNTFFQYRRGMLYSVQSDTDWGKIIFDRVD